MNVALDTIFPIVDESSAQLMAIKAQCLFAAGLITEAQKQVIENRAAGTLRCCGSDAIRLAAVHPT